MKKKSIFLIVIIAVLSIIMAINPAFAGSAPNNAVSRPDAPVKRNFRNSVLFMHNRSRPPFPRKMLKKLPCRHPGEGRGPGVENDRFFKRLSNFQVAKVRRYRIRHFSYQFDEPVQFAFFMFLTRRTGHAYGRDYFP